jgi:hypothetical protein
MEVIMFAPRHLLQHLHMPRHLEIPFIVVLAIALLISSLLPSHPRVEVQQPTRWMSVSFVAAPAEAPVVVVTGKRASDR